MWRQQGSQKGRVRKPQDAARQGVSVGPGKLRADEVRHRIRALEHLKSNITHQLAELATAAARKPMGKRIDDCTLANMSRSSFDIAVEIRCQNLRATLESIERERAEAEIELANG